MLKNLLGNFVIDFVDKFSSSEFIYNLMIEGSQYV